MAFTLVAWSQSVDTSDVLTPINALADQHVRVEGSNIVVPRGLNNLVGYYALGSFTSGARLEAPSLRRVVNIDFGGLDVLEEPGSPSNVILIPKNPIPLDEDEQLRALSRENGTGAQRMTVFAWLSDGVLEPVSGPVYTVAASGTTTLTSYAWTNVPLTFAQALPTGRYQVVGMRAQSAGCLAARLVFVGGIWRPGCVGTDALSDIVNPLFRAGGLGVWGEFDATQPPSVDFLSISADTTELVWLDLIYLGAG